MNTRLPTCLVAAFVAAAGVSSLSAATILWSTSLAPVSGFQGGSLNAGIFSQAGTVVYAENSGGPATTFDGINFAAGNPNLLPGGGDYSGFHGGINTTLAQTGRYGSSGAATLTLGGAGMEALVVGRTYLVQLLIADGRGGAAGRTVALNGTNLGQYGFAVGAPDYSWGPALVVTGTFTADAVQQSFTIENFDVGGSSVGSQYNALLVRSVPEMSSLLLGGAGALLLLVKRRRQDRA